MEDSTIVGVTTIVNTLKKIKTRVNYNTEDLQDFLSQEVTKETAGDYIELLEDITNALNRQKINKKDKDKINQVFTAIVMKSCESDCKSLIINKISQHCNVLAEQNTKLKEYWQKERDELNDKLKKAKEELKPQQVELDELDLSELRISTVPGKIISNKECTRILNDCRDRELAIDENFKYLKVDNKNIVRAYIRKSENGMGSIIQKPTTSKKYKS